MTSARASILAVLLFAAAGCASTSPSVTAADALASQATPPAPAEPSIDYANARITVAGVGDIMLGTDYPENHLPDDDGENFLTAVAPVLASADITFGNLEGVLQDGGEPAKECKMVFGCWLSVPVLLPLILTTPLLILIPPKYSKQKMWLIPFYT